MFSKILVANRGEIACRIIRTCQRLGIKSVAVYTEPDAQSPYVRLADESFSLGPDPKGYLNAEAIIAVAQTCGAQAIHPGYGFLSESPAFSQAISEVGLVFIGPPPGAMAALGTKINSLTIARIVGVPCLPWLEIKKDALQTWEKRAAAIGLPVVVKASEAGGGLGTTIARDSSELKKAVEVAKRVGERFFKSPSVHLEKYIENARHVEVQVFRDYLGNCHCLPERECSVQRRFQKVVEESPCVAIDAQLRGQLNDAAMRLMEAGNYVNTGTVEFLLDGQGDFYFLEVNCRLQVEHAVTEMVTGLDLVEHQIRIAAGETLSLVPDRLRGQGHAIESRIYAEDPQTLLPSSGRISLYREPSGEGVRVDSGVCQDYNVSPDYDPLIAKLIVGAETRPAAMTRMVKALRDFTLEGIATNIPLLLKVLEEPSFIKGEYHTGIIHPELLESPGPLSQGIDIETLIRFGQ